MKKSLLPVAFLALGTATFAQVQNGDFENWIKKSLFNHPVSEFNTISSNHEIFMEYDEINVSQVENGEGSAMRLENIPTVGGVQPAFYIFGETPGQSGEDLIFPGGMNASDPNVTGISVDMRYDFPGESSGFMIAQFKLDGNPVGPGNMGTGTFFFPISGQQDWENVVFDFETTIDTQYDQMVIGFATADLIGSDSDFPEGVWMEIDNVSLMNSTDIVPNGDFESWSQLTPLQTPVNMNVELNLINPEFQRSTDASEGQYALELISQNYDGFVQPAKATVGNATSEGGLAVIDIAEGHSMFSFDYKYLAVDDLAKVELTFYEEAGEAFIPVYGKIFELEPTNDYQSIEYSFGEELDNNFVSATKMSIEVSSGKAGESNEPNSRLLLDNMTTSTALSVFSGFTKLKSNRIIAVPNPTLGRVSFDLGKIHRGSYRVYNHMGHQIEYNRFRNTRYITYDLTDLPAGVYSFRFYYDEGIRMVRVVRN